MKRFFFLASLISTSLFSQTVPNYVPTNGLVGWWPFNGNANDLSGNGNNGVVNGPSLTSDRFGFNNAAYSFDGFNDYIDISNTNGLNTNQGITLSIWTKNFNPNGVTNHSYIYLVGNNPNARITISDNFEVSGSILNCNCSNDQVCSSFISPNSWTHIALSYNLQIGEQKLYINGALVDTKIEQMYTYYTSNNSAKRFGSYGFNSHYFKGILDDAGLWNRALTAAEIQTLYFGCTDTLAQNPTSATSTVGTNATFTALSSASGANYQWQAKNGSNFVNVSNAGQFSGATSSALTVTSVSSANNGLQVRCVVDHGDCVDTSAIAVLSSCFAINSQPANQYVVPSSSATFAVSTNDPACTYQWQTNAGFGFQNLSNAGQFSGVTSSTLTVSGVSLTNNNQIFRCLVSAGNCLDTTVSAKIVLSGVGLGESTLHQLVMSPNPTSGIVRFNLPINGTYRIVTPEGRLIETGDLKETINLSGFQNGVYLIEVKTAQQQRTFRAVKKE